MHEATEDDSIEVGAANTRAYRPVPSPRERVGTLDGPEPKRRCTNAPLPLGRRMLPSEPSAS